MIKTEKSVGLVAVLALAAFKLTTASASCEQDAVGIADGSVYLNASSEHSVSTPANNGRLNYTARSSWCASASDSNPYLQINLQTLYIICAVSTQGNSQADQWVKTYTLQSSTDGTNWTDYKEHGQSNKKSFKGNFDKNSPVKQILYDGTVARYVRFIVESNHSGACLRVEIFGVPRSKENIALLKPTRQSSTQGLAIASNAVDGVKSIFHEQCTHTQTTGSTNPWWRVDLKSEEPVAEVRILNRGDCCADRLNGAEIRVGNSDANGGAANHRCDNVTHIPAGQEKSYFCIPRAYGRYVYIRIPGNNKILTLCEVEVYSTYISRTSLAYNQPAQQINTNAGGVASRAVDGNNSTDYGQGSCTHTLVTTDPWWRVDLGSSVPVTEVVIVNRACDGDCAIRLNSFEIRIGNHNQSGGRTNPSCGGILSLDSGQTKSFYCVPVLVGRYVYVRIPRNNKVLTLCEVEVYSSTSGCSSDPVGVSNSSFTLDQRFSASSTRTGSNPYNGRLRNVSNSWRPSGNSDASDFLQIDLGSVYFVCGVATQGNPNADDWTKTYKIETSLNNVHWTIYVENHVVKNFTGNSDGNSVVRSELYEPVAAKFIRFYPVLFNNNKAMRVEVYGSLQGCLSSIGNERFVVRTLGTTASLELDANHRAGWSRLYGLYSWCSASVSLPQYLQFDAKKVITVSGVATQGDNVLDNWVTSYAISYGYDGQKWFDYSGGAVLTGNINKGSVVVNLLSSPFAAQYIRILPKTFKTKICMRVDLLVCKNFQVPFVFVELDDAVWSPSSAGAVTLTCATNYSKQRPPAQIYEWQKDGAVVPGSSSSLTITYTNATDIRNNYQCARKSLSVRDVHCNATYHCSASLVDLPQIRDDAKGNLTVILKVPGKPVVQVNQADIQARSALVRWSYTPGIDETPVTSFALQYRNSTVTTDIDPLPCGASSTQLNDLRPYTTYSINMTATSDLGTGEWSNAVNFRTSTDRPSIAPQNIRSEKINETTFKISWDPLSREKSNGDVEAYEVERNRVASSSGARATCSEGVVLQNTTEAFVVLHGLTSCSIFKVKVRAYTSAGPGDFGSLPYDIATSTPGPPSDVRTENAEKRTVTLQWNTPALHGNDLQKYTVIYDGKKEYCPDFRHTGELETVSLTSTVQNLYPGTKYSFVIIATTHCGSSENSSVVSSQTLKDAPLPPVPREPAPDLTVTDLPVNVTVWAAPQDNGPISYYQVLVHLVKESTDTVSDWTKLGSDLYIAAQIPSVDVNPSLAFTLGDGNEYGGFVNKELSSGQKYNIYSRALTVKSKKRSVEDVFLISEASLIAKIEVKQDDQSENRADHNCKSSANSGCNKMLCLVSNIVLAALLILSVGWNVFLYRARRTSNVSKKYSADVEKREATKNEQDIDDAQPPDSDYMELQPEQRSHVADQQYVNRMAYENASVQLCPVTNNHEADVYEEIIA